MTICAQRLLPHLHVMSRLPLHNLRGGALQLRSAGEGESTEDIIKVPRSHHKKVGY